MREVLEDYWSSTIHGRRAAATAHPVAPFPVNWLYQRKHGCTAAILDNQALPLFEAQQINQKKDFAQEHPILDAVIGGLILAAGFGGMIAIWISVGAGV